MKHLEIQLEHPVSALILTSMGYLSDALWAAGWVLHSWLKAALVYPVKANTVSYSSCVSSTMNCILIALFESALALLLPASWTSALNTHPSVQDSPSLFWCWESEHNRKHHPKNYSSEPSLLRTKSTRVSLSVWGDWIFSHQNFPWADHKGLCLHAFMIITLMISFQVKKSRERNLLLTIIGRDSTVLVFEVFI